MFGNVLWFNDKLGYGFIGNKNINSDIFFHFKEIQMDEFKTLKEGDYVKFNFDKELTKATNVELIRKGKDIYGNKNIRKKFK